MPSFTQNAYVPVLTAPNAKVADPGKVRYGDGSITAGVPTLSIPDAKVADPGKVRYGDGSITAGVPLRG
jgi:hypothetical protein